MSFGDLYRINTNLNSQLIRGAINLTNRQLNDSLRRLSTGLRVSKAEDDSASFSLAAKVSSRIAGMVQALQNTSDAKSVLDITESNLNLISEQLIQIKKLVIQATNGVYSDDERNFLRASINGYATEIQAIVDSTEYNKINLLDGTYDVNYQTGEGVDDTLNFAIADDFSIEDIQIFEVSTEGVFSSSGAITTATQLNNLDQFAGLQAGDSFDINLTANDGTVTTVTLNMAGSKGALATETIGDVINLINGTSGFSAVLDAQGNIDVTETVVTVGNQLAISIGNFVEAASLDGATGTVPITFNATSANLETSFTSSGAITAATNINSLDQFSNVEGQDTLQLNITNRTGTNSVVNITMSGAAGTATTTTLGNVRDAINAQTGGAFTASIAGGQLVIQQNSLSQSSFNVSTVFIEGSLGDAVVPSGSFGLTFSYSALNNTIVSNTLVDDGLANIAAGTLLNDISGFDLLDDDDTLTFTVSNRLGTSRVINFSLDDGTPGGGSNRTVGDVLNTLNATLNVADANGVRMSASIVNGQFVFTEINPARQSLNLTSTFTENNIDATPKSFAPVSFAISDFLEVSDDTGLVVGLGFVDFGSGTQLTASISSKLIDNVNASLNRVAQTLNSLGVMQVQLSNREVFLANSINNNSAFLSRIQDADFAKETSNFLKLTIQQRFQLIAASQANVQPATLLDFL